MKKKKSTDDIFFEMCGEGLSEQEKEDYRHFSKEEEEFIDELAAALGSRISASDQKKLDFSRDICEELFYVLAKANDKENYARLYANIEKTARNAEESLKVFKTAIFEARRTLKSITPLANCLGDSFSNNCDLKYVIGWFERYNSRLAKVTPSMKKAGSRKIASDQVAKMIALSYVQYFGSISTAKGNFVGNRDKQKCKSTPYDRVCKVVAEHCNIELSAHALRKATEQIQRRAKKGK